MDQKPSLDMVYLAVSALYNNPNTSEKERASQWLGELQKCVHAWTIADELLHHKRDLESCYFAAQTMRTKIHQSFHELPMEAHVSLRDSLLDHISQITETTNTVIVTQLCLALADLALQMPSWQRPTVDLLNRYSQTHIWPLLEILTVLPEELQSRSVRLGENRRVEVLEELKSCASMVNEFLTHCCNNCENYRENVLINVKLLRCFTSWVSVGAISLVDVMDNRVMIRAFDILSVKPEGDKTAISGALHEAATDFVCTLLQCLESNNNQVVLENYLFNSVLGLEVAYHMSVANEDQEKSMNYCRIFTESAESVLEKIMNASQGEENHVYASKLIELVLICVGHHDYEVAEITFNFWYLLSENLYDKNVKSLTETFRPYVERLVTALCRHCQMEPDHEGLLEEGDDFKDFRTKVYELIKDVVFIVGSSNCFRHMFINLQTPAATWDASEAALFIMSAVAKNISTNENEVVPKVVEAILNLPDNTHVAVRYTSVLLLGELCEWIEKHPVTLDPILQFLVCCLPQPGIGAAAATALQNICTICNESMCSHVPYLLQLLHQVDTFAISNNAIIGLLKGVAAIVGCLPHSEVPPTLRELCKLQLTPLCQLIEQDVTPVRGAKSDPVLWLDRLSSVLRNINFHCRKGEQNPCKEVMIELWPILSKTFDKYQSDIRIMERCCRSVRFMLRCVSQQLRELLDSLVTQIVRLYALYKHSCFLYLGSILVDEYATDPVCVQGLLDMLQAFIEPTFQILQEENGLRNHPDTVDDFFRLCARFLQRAPLNFLQCPAMPHIFQCALMACSLDHKEACTSVMKFFYDLISVTHGRGQSDHEQRRKLVAQILGEFGRQLVHNLIHACIFYLSNYLLSEVADVIVELLDFDRELTGKWLGDVLEQLPKQGNSGVLCITQQQVADFHAAIGRSDTSKSVSHALRDLARLYR